jgi:hypothetical protein
MIRPKTQKLKISQSLLNQVSTARFDLSQTSYIGLLTHKSATLWRGDRLKAWLPSVPILTGHTITERADKTNRTDTTTQNGKTHGHGHGQNPTDARTHGQGHGRMNGHRHTETRQTDHRHTDE